MLEIEILENQEHIKKLNQFLNYQQDRLYIHRISPDYEQITIPDNEFPEIYEIPNGLLKRKRDIFNKLAVNKTHNPRKIYEHCMV
jgi:hypothetical protein